MSSTDATETTHPKRVRFDATATSITETGQPSTATRKAPKAVAEAFLNGHISSLQPQISTIVGNLGNQYITKLHKLHNKQMQVSKMQDDDEFIPRSARLEFAFRMTKKAEATLEFQTLQEDTNKLIIDFRKGLKKQIIKATRIEIDVMYDDLHMFFCRAIRMITHSFAVAERKEIDIDRLVFTVMNKHHECLLKHVKMDWNELCSKYKHTFHLNSAPTPFGSNRAHLPSLDVNESPFVTAVRQGLAQRDIITAAPVQTTAVREETHATIISSLKRVLESVFVSTWDSYLDQIDKNSVELQLKKLSTEYFEEQHTVASVAVVDDELPADRLQLQELVRKQTEAETKKIAAELDRLRNQLAAMKKNGPTRGPGGPSATKTNRQNKSNNQPESSPSQSSQKQKNQSQKRNSHGGASKDTTNDNTKQKHTRGNLSQSQKKSASSTRRSKP